MDCFRKSLFPVPNGSPENRPPPGGNGGLNAALAAARTFAAAARAPSTTEAYQRDFERFEKWCRACGIVALPAPPEALAGYLASEAKRGVRPVTLARRAAAVASAHRVAGHRSPTESEIIRSVLAGIRRVRGTAPARKPPIVSGILKAMLAALPDTLVGLRDRAILLLGFASAMRRSELIGLDVEDLRKADGGLLIRIRKSKTDQEAAGSAIAVRYGLEHCPIAALREWLDAAGITSGPIFRPIRRGGHVVARRLTDRSIADVVKHCAERADLDPSTVSPHALRAGLLTEAANQGASIPKLLEISRHRQIESLRAYLRPTDLFADHAADGLL